MVCALLGETDLELSEESIEAIVEQVMHGLILIDLSWLTIL